MPWGRLQWVALVLAHAFPSVGAMAQVEDEEKTLKLPIIEKVNQLTYTKSVNACGPTSLLMQFQNGTPEMQAGYAKLLGSDSAKRLNYIVDRFFINKRSEISPKIFRWGAHGVFTKDMTAAAQDWLEESGGDRSRMNGMWLTRKDSDESDPEFTRRIHREIRNSIRSGVPPILNLRSFVAREKLNKPDQREWQVAQNHYILVHEVPDTLPETARGFRLGVIDPNGGHQTEVFVFHEPHGQAFSALKGNEMEGKWVGGRHFMVVAAPKIDSLRPANLNWSERVVSIANYLIGDF